MQTTHPNPSLRLNIIGTGKGLPSRLVPSTEIDTLLGIKEGRTEKLSGLAQRYFLADDESADAMFPCRGAPRGVPVFGVTGQEDAYDAPFEGRWRMWGAGGML